MRSLEEALSPLFIVEQTISIASSTVMAGVQISWCYRSVDLLPWCKQWCQFM